jgi:acyl-CoA thioesterase I
MWAGEDMRIVVLADSLAMPRKDVRFEHTWPYRLEAALREAGLTADVVNCGARRRTADMLLADFTEHVIFKEPTDIVIQVGVVDCAPRIFSRSMRRYLNSRWVPSALRSAVIRHRSGRRARIVGRDPLRLVYTKPARFAAVLEEFGSRLQRLPWPIRVYVVPILFDGSALEPRSPGFGKNVAAYNAILAEFSARHDGDWIAPEGLLDAHRHVAFGADGIHLSSLGNAVLAQEVGRRVLSRTARGAGVGGHS